MDGEFPVRDFLNSLGTRERAKVVQVIKRLELDGPTLPFPYSSQVTGKLRELRTQYGKSKYRVFYYGDRLRTFVLLHGIRKQNEALTNQDKQIAFERMEIDIELKKRGNKE